MKLFKHKVTFEVDDIISHAQLSIAEQQALQKGMNYKVTPEYSVFLMSIRHNAPYKDEIDIKTNSIIYEGHDARKDHCENPKTTDQPYYTPKGSLTENGKFFVEAQAYILQTRKDPHKIKVYEKIKDGIWTYKGFFNLVDAKYISDGTRNVFKFYLKPISVKSKTLKVIEEIPFNRLIPTDVKIEVWQRDEGKCVQCDSTINLHFDHDLPFSKGGTSLTAKNIKLLCMKCNLKKSNKIISILVA
ncbi:MAG TPA: HNH endonuclease [Ignavibacteria bacterium]|jgi:hypothetical protein